MHALNSNYLNHITETIPDAQSTALVTILPFGTTVLSPVPKCQFAMPLTFHPSISTSS